MQMNPHIWHAIKQVSLTNLVHDQRCLWGQSYMGHVTLYKWMMCLMADWLYLECGCVMNCIGDGQLTAAICCKYTHLRKSQTGCFMQCISASLSFDTVCIWTTAASLCFTTTLLCRAIPYQLLFFQKIKPSSWDTGSNQQKRWKILWQWFLWRSEYRPPGMLPAVVSFLAKIYDSRKEWLQKVGCSK
jgi:hypothetical protein